ncbi:MAG: tryptophan 7-halogenase [Acidobacteria bacterium]|nr:tryptophan 7-halogenase [Acidobacteriota bacterium]
MQRSGEYDVLAIGGGPAGATAAHLLARWGYRVALVERARARPRGLAESLPPSATRLFHRFDLADLLQGSHAIAATGNTSWWGADGCRVERFGRAGYQIHRPGFDRALIARARQSGALVRTGTAVKRLHSSADGIVVDWRSDAGRTGCYRARFVLDCSGRAGVVARRGLRRASLYRTQALVGFWRHRHRFPMPGDADQTHTSVESYRDGWAWSVPISPRVRSVAVMTAGTSTTYLRELARAPHHATLVAGAALTGRPWSSDASVYDSCRYADDRLLLVGDAGSFIDPLSSFGVKKAMMSAWRAAVVVNTVLQNGEASGEAHEYFERGERDVFVRSLQQSRKFFHDAAGFHGQAFWAGRSAAVDDVLDREQAIERSTDGEALSLDPDVVRALRSLKEDVRLDLRPQAGVRVEPVVEADGRALVKRDALATASLKDPIRYVAGVELPRLFNMASSYHQVPDLFEAYNRAASPVALHDFLGALSVLIAKGALSQQVPT